MRYLCLLTMLLVRLNFKSAESDTNSFMQISGAIGSDDYTVTQPNKILRGITKIKESLGN